MRQLYDADTTSVIIDFPSWTENRNDQYHFTHSFFISFQLLCNTGIDEKVKRNGSLSNKLFSICYIVLKIEKMYWPHLNYLFGFSPINRFCLCCHFYFGNKRNQINVDWVNKCSKLSSNIIKRSRIGQRSFVLWLRIVKQSITLIFYSFYAIQSHVILNEKKERIIFFLHFMKFPG